ncbi:TPA: 3-isopropylmalate dehydratase small subunit [Candidatus Bathyarchaeota archaeon]|nr:3-isopropylmalate dehydratase small subunit [Candidatus Bathyarchaeota archaeon]
MIITGKATVFGDNINTDVIIPGRYLTILDAEELAKHAMEGLDPDFPEKAREGVIIVAGRNFGCGSSREQAPIALKNAGVKCVLAESFARIFFRNSINVGLPILECPNITQHVSEGDQLTIDLVEGKIINNRSGAILRASPLPNFLLTIIKDGGLIEHLKRRVHKNEKI